tara:strand:- start:115 stop:768 length:654 start_codon:yes stop_codon:yes gene_type:complete
MAQDLDNYGAPLGEHFKRLLKGAPSDITPEDLLARQIRYDENILNKLTSGQMSYEDASRFITNPNRSRLTYPVDYELPVSEELSNAHSQIDTLINNNTIKDFLIEAANNNTLGQSYESDPNILSEQTTLLNYLAGAVSEEGTKNRYMYGIDDKELENRMSQIKSYPSTVDSAGVERFTIPLMVPGSFPPKYERESRSMQHWIEDYPEWINRSSINNP